MLPARGGYDEYANENKILLHLTQQLNAVVRLSIFYYVSTETRITTVYRTNARAVSPTGCPARRAINTSSSHSYNDNQPQPMLPARGGYDEYANENKILLHLTQQLNAVVRLSIVYYVSAETRISIVKSIHHG